MLTRFINSLWVLSQRGEYGRFWKGAPDYLSAQQRMLQQYIRTNKDTAFGRDHDFGEIRDYKTYTEKVPIIDQWAALEPYVNQLISGQNNILTRENVIGFEETSGTETAAKCIPYTKTLKQEFEHAVAVWMVALADSIPGAFHGKSYWSISPALKEKRRTAGGLPIGLENDTDYFNPITAWMLSKILIQPPVRHLHDNATFYRETIAALLAEAGDLRFLSVWSPTFFLQMDQYLRETGDKRPWSQVFPHLACISTWQDAQAAVWMDQVRHCAGDIPIQGKGLLATEGVTTIPIGLEDKQVLAWRSHFFEFRDTDSCKIGDAGILREGGIYETILTTGGGLYRYATRDLVRCEGWYRGLPALRFLGRAGRVSDLTGEKLSEHQVVEAFKNSIFTREFEQIYLFPLKNESSAHYVVLTYGDPGADFDPVAALNQLDALLCSNPYYDQARKAGQLGGLEWRPAEENPFFKVQHYLRSEKKIREGDMKIPVLLNADLVQILLHQPKQTFQE